MVEGFDRRVRKLLETHEFVRIDGQDLNNVTESGVYIGEGCGNSPSPDTIELIVTRYSESWIVQECKVAMVNIYLRSLRNGVWNNWKILDVGILKAHMHPDATNELSGFLSPAEKLKLENQTDYVHPETHPVDMIVTTPSKEFVTREDKVTWNKKSDFDGDYRSLSNLPEDYNSVWIGEEAPTDKSSLWIDNVDEDLNESLTSSAMEEIRITMSGFKETLDKFKYALEKELDPGYFLDREPAGVEPPKNPLITYSGNPFEGNVKSILCKRGLADDLKQRETLMEGEFGFCIDSEELYIGNKGVKRLIAKVGGAGGSSGGNVTGEYITLETPDRAYYRIFLDNSGKLKIYNADAFNEQDPETTESQRFKGLIINHAFGGGEARKNVSAVTHSFIELYNTTNLKINLKGLSVQAASSGYEWHSLPLSGIVPPKTSFLIRCSQVTDKNTQNPSLVIEDYDMDWSINISDMGFKIYLTVGIVPSIYPNPSNINGQNAIAVGYIDLLGVGGETAGQSIDGYETAYLNVANNYTSVHRIDFKDSASSDGSSQGNNMLDCEPLNWKLANKNIYRPRSIQDGKWDIHYNKLKLSQHRPMIINMGFGQDGNSTRTFSWQSILTIIGFLKYRKVGETIFKYIESDRMVVKHLDDDATKHSIIVRNLTPGTYEYMVGEEGAWSDQYSFVVHVPTDDEHIKFLHITDQQAVNELDYVPWKIASNYISANEDYQFILNSGDISDNANRAYEWRYYYDYAKYNISNFPHMNCCGNNDLINKQLPDAFNYYCTVENSPSPSLYSWNYGYIHFVVVNSNIDVKGWPAGVPQPMPIDPQIEWINKDLAKPENKKRWTIVMMHESSYSIVDSAKLKPFHEVFAKNNVDLVISGHHHMYSRSHGMGPINPDGTVNILSRASKYKNGNIPTSIEERTMRNGGVVYVMSQATGSKLQGKTVVAADNKAPWRGDYFRDFAPSYVTYDISYNQLKMSAYRIDNVVPMIPPPEHDPVKVPTDEILIIKS